MRKPCAECARPRRLCPCIRRAWGGATCSGAEGRSRRTTEPSRASVRAVRCGWFERGALWRASRASVGLAGGRAGSSGGGGGRSSSSSEKANSRETGAPIDRAAALRSAAAAKRRVACLRLCLHVGLQQQQQHAPTERASESRPRAAQPNRGARRRQGAFHLTRQPRQQGGRWPPPTHAGARTHPDAPGRACRNAESPARTLVRAHDEQAALVALILLSGAPLAPAGCSEYIGTRRPVPPTDDPPARADTPFAPHLKHPFFSPSEKFFLGFVLAIFCPGVDLGWGVRRRVCVLLQQSSLRWSAACDTWLVLSVSGYVQLGQGHSPAHIACVRVRARGRCRPARIHWRPPPHGRPLHKCLVQGRSHFLTSLPFFGTIWYFSGALNPLFGFFLVAGVQGNRANAGWTAANFRIPRPGFSFVRIRRQNVCQRLSDQVVNTTWEVETKRKCSLR